MNSRAIKEKYKKIPKPIKASFCFLICSFLQKAISMFTMPIFTRVMSSSEYGEYGIYTSWLGIISVFVTFNLSWGVYAQGIVKYEDNRKVYTSCMQGLSVVLLSIWFLFYFIFKDIINNLLGLDTKFIYAMFLNIGSTSMFNYWSCSMKVDYKYRLLVFITLFVSIFNPLVSLVLIYFMDDNVFGRVLGATIVFLVAYLWMFFKQMFDGKKFYSKKYWSKSLKIGIPLIPHYLSQTLLNNADKIMIGYMVSEASSGIYSVAYSASSIMIIFNNALMQTFSPWIYRKIRDNKISSIAPVAYMSIILIALVNLILIAFAPEILKILAPAEYYEAIWVIPPIAMSVLFMFMYDLFAKFEFYYEKTKLISVMTTLGAILNIILNYIFINLYGFYAAGYTTLICYVVYALFHYFGMKKVCKSYCRGSQPYRGYIILAIVSVFLLLAFGVMLLYDYSIFRYIVISMLMLFALCNIKIIVNIFSLLKRSAT